MKHRFGNSTAGNRKSLQRIVQTARHIVGGEFPSLQDIYTRRCIMKARRIIKDSSHPSHRLLSLLPSGRRLRSIRSRTSRLRDSFFPQAIRCNICRQEFNWLYTSPEGEGGQLKTQQPSKAPLRAKARVFFLLWNKGM